MRIPKVLIAVSIALLLIVIVPKTIKYWPVGKVQDVAYIWLNQSKLIRLLELAEQTPYKNIKAFAGTLWDTYSSAVSHCRQRVGAPHFRSYIFKEA